MVFPFTKRPYTGDDVKRLQGKTRIDHTLARLGAEKLWREMSRKPIRALGALTGEQAVQQVKAGLRGIYVSGWQVAADANGSGQTFPDQSLYPVDSVPNLVKRINNALLRAEQIEHLEGNDERDWMVPIVADAEAGFGGPLNAFELMKAMIEAGAAGVHFEDQLSSAKKCGHLAGKVLVPTSQFIQTLVAARLAADVMEVPTVIIARTDADSAKMITSDIDEENDRHFIDGGAKRTVEGFFHLKGSGIDRCIARGLAFAPYADALWMETSTPNIEQAREFAAAIHAVHPGKPLFYNASPSFAWTKHLSYMEIASFQDELAALGYTFMFVTLAGYHALAHSMFELASSYKDSGMTAYVDLQTREFRSEAEGYTAVRHQRQAGTSYFDAVTQLVSSGLASTAAMKGSTEDAQFSEQAPVEEV